MQKKDSHVSQSGAEVLVDVGFQDWVEVLEFDVANKGNYKYLVINKRRKQDHSLVKAKSMYIILCINEILRETLQSKSYHPLTL